MQAPQRWWRSWILLWLLGSCFLCLLLLAPNGKDGRAPPSSTQTSCGACLLADLHLHLTSSKLQSPSPFFSFPSSSPCLCVGDSREIESDKLERERECENEWVSCLGCWFRCSTQWAGVLTCGTKEAKQVTLHSAAWAVLMDHPLVRWTIR